MSSRAQLQQLAKQHGIKANMKNSEIEAALTEKGIQFGEAKKGLSARDSNVVSEEEVNASVSKKTRVSIKKQQEVELQQQQPDTKAIVVENDENAASKLPPKPTKSNGSRNSKPLSKTDENTATSTIDEVAPLKRTTRKSDPLQKKFEELPVTTRRSSRRISKGSNENSNISHLQEEEEEQQEKPAAASVNMEHEEKIVAEEEKKEEKSSNDDEKEMDEEEEMENATSSSSRQSLRRRATRYQSRKSSEKQQQVNSVADSKDNVEMELNPPTEIETEKLDISNTSQAVQSEEIKEISDAKIDMKTEEMKQQPMDEEVKQNVEVDMKTEEVKQTVEVDKEEVVMQLEQVTKPEEDKQIAIEKTDDVVMKTTEENKETEVKSTNSEKAVVLEEEESKQVVMEVEQDVATKQVENENKSVSSLEIKNVEVIESDNQPQVINIKKPKRMAIPLLPKTPMEEMRTPTKKSKSFQEEKEIVQEGEKDILNSTTLNRIQKKVEGALGALDILHKHLEKQKRLKKELETVREENQRLRDAIAQEKF